MKKPLTSLLAFSLCLCVCDFSLYAQTTGLGSRLNEIFQLTNLQTGLNDPWEITYSPDGYLWVTESRGYKVYRIDPSTGTKTTVLDISQNSTFLPVGDRSFNLQFNFSGQGNPQGGLAGLAIHPDFMDPVTPKKYVYISYIHQYVTTVASNGGVFFINQLVRFTYNTGTNKLESPVSLCDTLPGSSDHNSQRMIIAPVGGVNYLFYAAGDMGAGQFGNSNRANHAQSNNYYEGKILRFNLESDGDSGLDAWIPDDNPFNTTSPAKQTAIWANGIRNNQGFAFATINGVDYLYGTSHGPFSDDEVNIIERGKNYGHPQVIGFSSDHNYDNAKAGIGTGSLPLIGNEATYVSGTIGTSNYGDPIYCFYPAPKGNTGTSGTIQYIYNQFNSGNQNNSGWPSEGTSGLGIYTNSIIPGWKNSLLIACLKGGKVMRLKLNSDGASVVSPGAGPVYNDTISYYRSQNRFRDVAISADGKTIYIVIDKSSSTSGPSTGNPIISACAGCLQKYTFLGYTAQSSGNLYRSNIPASITVASGKSGICENANTVVINSANNNNNLWVPITDTNSNVIAEINANGNDLDTVTTSLYATGSIRIQNSKKYLGRNITITPQTQPGSSVRIRLYISKTEYDALQASAGSGISAISDMKILKNSDPCGSGIASNTTLVNPTVSEAFGSNAYVLQGDITGFSSFYFGSALITLPAELVNFKGTLQNDNTVLLQWQTASENNTKRFIIERSVDGNSFTGIGSQAAAGNSETTLNYDYTDNAASAQSANLLYYRLKIEDNDGQYKYSDIITVSLSYVAGRVTISPNPVADVANVNIAVAANGKVVWKLVDNAGRVLRQNTVDLKTGNNNLPIDLSSLAAGSYYLNLSGDGVDQKIKLQKL